MTVPTGALIIAVTTVIVVVIACLTLLAYAGKDASQLRSFINTVLNIGSVVLSGGGLIYAGSANAKASQAADKSAQAADQTNGGLDARIHAAVTRALEDKE